MKRFQKMLVWVDETRDGQTALQRATPVARETGASLTLTHALQLPPRLFRTLYKGADELHGMLRREWEQRLEELAAPLRSEGLDASVKVVVGKPHLAVIRAVLESGFDLVVKPAEDDSDGPFFGSVDMHLLRKCPSAVWIVKPGSAPATRILATVDPDPRDEEINRRIMAVATSLAEMRGGTLDVLHAWQPFAEQVLASRVDEDELRGYVEAARQAADTELHELLAATGTQLDEDRVHLISGDAHLAIPEFVRHHEVGLLVMGTVCRVGVAGFLIGNTAEAVLSRVRCSVLALKPEGFVSPVTLDD